MTIDTLQCLVGGKRRLMFKCDIQLKRRIEEFMRQEARGSFGGAVTLLMVTGYLYLKSNPSLCKYPYHIKGETYRTALTVTGTVLEIRDRSRKLIAGNKTDTQNTLIHYGLMAYQNGRRLTFTLTD